MLVQTPASKIIVALALQGEPYEIQNQEVLDTLIVIHNIVAQGVVVRNCTFKETVIFEKIDFNCGIKFIDCNFEKTLTISDCTAQNNDLKFNFDGYHIELSNTKVSGGLHFIGNNQIDRGVRIWNKSIIQILHVDSITSRNGHFAIHDSTIENTFEILQCNLNLGLEVRNNSVINAKVLIENVTAGSLTFTNSNFGKDIHIWAGKVGSFIFNDGAFAEELVIKAVPISNLSIIGAEFKKSLTLDTNDPTNNMTGILSKVYLSSSKFSEQFVINGSNLTIDDFTLDFSNRLEGSIYLNSCNLLKTELSGDNYKGNVVFNHCNFNSLSFDFFYNYSSISIISAKSFGSQSEISVTHSNLGKSQFFNVFFNSFEKIAIYHSIVTEITSANVKWFEPHKLNPTIKSEQGDFTNKREIFRQLKYALQNQGDRIESLRFKSLEMKAYKQELLSSQKWYKKLFNNDRFILWIGQTNNFGLNWLKPVWLILAFGLIFYCLIVVGVSENLSYSFNFDAGSFKTTICEFAKYSYAFPELMNPVHSLDKIFTKTNQGGFTLNFLDYALKIFLAFFIYQIISAFRKFAK